MKNPPPASAAPTPPARCSAFDGPVLLAAGSLADVAVTVAHAFAKGASGPLLIFDDETGRVVDIDWRGSDEEIRARYAEPPVAARGPGRPRLGVVAREITLLPAQWEWLARQPGGASVTIRKLVERARRENPGIDAARVARESTYRFLHAIAGDHTDFEEMARALFGRDDTRLRGILAAWPNDIRVHALAMLAPAFADTVVDETATE